MPRTLRSAPQFRIPAGGQPGCHSASHSRNRSLASAGPLSESPFHSLRYLVIIYLLVSLHLAKGLSNK